jgi:hypothetical protein
MTEEATPEVAPVKRGRGRPRKVQAAESVPATPPARKFGASSK